MYLKSIVLITLLLVFGAWAQDANDDETRRQREHEAVKAHIERNMPGWPASRAAESGPSKGDTNTPPAFMLKHNDITNHEPRKGIIMNGNRLTTVVFNYGGIGPGGEDPLRGVDNVVWRNLSYVYQFGPLVGASVPDSADPTQRLRIMSDGVNDYVIYGLQELDPITNERWQWEPLAGYSDPNQDNMASNPAPDDDGDGKPDSWPRDWYNETLGEYVWPGLLTVGENNADLEVFWGMDDRHNAEFPYYPFVDDSSRRGLGVQVEGRAFQWSNALAENTVFFLYTITNVSDKDLDSVVFAIYGDPDLGVFGSVGSENKDDNGFFIPPYTTPQQDVSNIPIYARSMVYFWDPDGEGSFGLPTGYLGCKFLESPGNPDDGIDNDGDGMTDERQDDGIDNDGDWDPLLHDVGIDGIAGTDDEGEGDGVPTRGRRLDDGTLDPLAPGEPNFEFTDLDEADQIGLTSFSSWVWNAEGVGGVNNDEEMWRRTQPNNPATGYNGFSQIQQNTDIVFIYGSGYISLKKGETKRISMALLFGENLDDLLLSAESVQRIYNNNYQFFRPPTKPKVTAVPGDKKVTLYWDDRAEQSIDPLTGKDFEGYVIYRSTDPSFDDIQQITDGRGTRFLSEPLKMTNGRDARFDVAVRPEPFTDVNNNGKYDDGEPFVDLNQDGEWSTDIEDRWKGYHPVPYPGRGVQYYLGDNTGLVHSFVDSNDVVNGQTYYYAVVAYDHGDDNVIPPSETTKKITLDPITQELTFDDNTVSAIPGKRAAGFVSPAINSKNVVHEQGVSTADVELNVLNELIVPDDQYTLSFDDSMVVDGEEVQTLNYSLTRESPHTETFFLFDDKITDLDFRNIIMDEHFEVRDASGTVYTEDDFELLASRGAIKRKDNSRMTDGVEYTITYRFFPIYQSRLLGGQDGNPVFDGITVTVRNDPEMIVDTERSGFSTDDLELDFSLYVDKLNPAKVGREEAAEYYVVFSESEIDTALDFGQGTPKPIPVNYSVYYDFDGQTERLITLLRDDFNDDAWTPGDDIFFYKPGSDDFFTDTLTWTLTIGTIEDTAQGTRLPTDGDTLYLRTKRPLTTDDVYVLNTESAKEDNAVAKSRLDDVYVVPNPYVGYSDIEPTTRIPGKLRGERRIYFENLPPQCTIRIFTLSGQLVRKIEHNTGLENGREYWNLLSEDGFSVAYGVYVAHIDAPGVGEKIVKFALIK